MPRRLDPAVVEARRALARVPGTRAEHARAAGLTGVGWLLFTRDYGVEEVGQDGQPLARGVARPRPGRGEVDRPVSQAPPPRVASAGHGARPPVAAPTTPRATSAALATADALSPVQRGALTVAVAILLRQPGVARAARELHGEVRLRYDVGASELERLLEGEAAACGRVVEGNALGTWRAACSGCGRPL